MKQHLFVTVLVLAVAVAAGLASSQLIRAHPADASILHRYTLRLGDRVSIPALRQACSVEKEGGSVELFCARPQKARHQVTIFRDQILVWKVGNPDRPAWTGKP